MLYDQPKLSTYTYWISEFKKSSYFCQHEDITDEEICIFGGIPKSVLCTCLIWNVPFLESFQDESVNSFFDGTLQTFPPDKAIYNLTASSV